MTTSRRDMLCHAAGALTALTSVACGMASPAFSQAPPRRREVVVNGRRVRTVDLHAHCHVPEANTLMGLKVQTPGLVVSPERIKAMDEQGIDIEALSLNPIFWYKAAPDLAKQVVNLQNEKLAEICAAQPERFVGLASVALQHPERAAEQLDNSVKHLGLRGALISGSVNGEELSDPKFHPFWAKAEQLGVVIFIHPQGTDELRAGGRLKGNGVLENVIGNPLETTIALSHLIFEGTLDAFPGAQDLWCSRGRISPVLCRSLGSRLRDLSGTMHQDAREAQRISPAALLRRDGLHTRRVAPPRRRSRRQPDRDGDGLPVSVDHDVHRPHPRYPRVERCRARGDTWGKRRLAAGHQTGIVRTL
jgi:hypothetical protein